MLRPLPRRGQLSAIVLLGGKVTGKHAIDYAEGITDALIIAVDYPYEPRATYSAFEMLRDVPSVRRALLDMVPSVMLVIDYLWTQPDIDASSVILIGYSFGAQLVPVIFANDPRPSVAVMVYGGGDLQQLIRHNVRRYKDAFTSEVVAGLGAVLLHPLEPLRHAREISPRPLLMVNGTADEQIPRECPEKLFDEALPPKKIIWLKSAHVHPKGVELRREIADTLKVELKRVGMLR
jgi:dienelactone hydrolase